MSRSVYPRSQPNNIPQELRDRPQWVAHRGKCPINPNTGHAASTTDPATWGTYDAAVAMVVAGRADGIGFVFTLDDPYIGIDLDHCRDPETGQIAPWAMAIAERFPTIYKEVSLSGTGLHGIGRGVLPDDATGRHPQGIGIFWHSRFFVVTSNVLPGHETLGDFDHGALEAFYREISPDKPQRPAPAAPTLTLDDHNLLERLSREPGGKAARLLVGDATGYPDFSTARFALATKMSFYTDDAEQIARIIRSSGLFKDVDSERERDRKAELDARNAVEQYVGPRYDPAYRTPPSIPSAPPLNAITTAVSATCPEQLMTAQARIAELEANIERERELRVAAEERVERLSFERSELMQIIRNPDLGPGPKLTHFVTVMDLGARIANGEESARHGFRLPATTIAAKSGQKVSTVRNHLKAAAKAGWLTKTNVREPSSREGIDEETGEITSGTQDVTYIEVPENNIIHLIAPVSSFRKDEPENRGGKRTPTCKEHPDAATITTSVTICADCHAELDRRVVVHEPDPWGTSFAPQNRSVVNTSLLGAKTTPQPQGWRASSSAPKFAPQPPLDDDSPDHWAPPPIESEPWWWNEGVGS